MPNCFADGQREFDNAAGGSQGTRFEMKHLPPDNCDRLEFLWRWPEDAGRVAPVPGGASLTVLAGEKFSAGLVAGGRPAASKFSELHGCEAVALMVPEVGELSEITLELQLPGQSHAARILALPPAEVAEVSAVVPPVPGAHGICANLAGAARRSRRARHGAHLRANTMHCWPRISMSRGRMTAA